MAFADLTSRDAVLAAVGELKSVGRVPFVKKYGREFGYDETIAIWIDGERFYDVRAVVAAAHGYQHPDRGPLQASQLPRDFMDISHKLRELDIPIAWDPEDQVAALPDPRSRNGRPLSVGLHRSEVAMSQYVCEFTLSRPIQSVHGISAPVQEALVSNDRRHLIILGLFEGQEIDCRRGSLILYRPEARRLCHWLAPEVQPFTLIDGDGMLIQGPPPPEDPLARLDGLPRHVPFDELEGILPPAFPPRRGPIPLYALVIGVADHHDMKCW